MKLSEKALAISPSLTLNITAMAKEMKAQGLDVVGFGAGEPDFDTPRNIKEAAKCALDKGLTKYTAVAGTNEFKQAICQYLKEHEGLVYKPMQIVASNGAKHSLFNTFQAILNPGDEVLIMSPYWLTYPELIKMADGVPVFVETKESNNFEPLAQDIIDAITERTKAIIVNDPNNPCGCVYSLDTLQSIAAIAKEHNLFIVSDEIYGDLVYGDNKHTSIASLSEDAFERTILINGLSKSYAMTGWRVGYSASSVEIAKVMGSYQSHATSNVCSISQYAGVEALTGPQQQLRAMKKEFDRRRKLMVKLINQMDSVSCREPQGAFYVMMNISALKGKSIDGVVLKDSVIFAEQLLKKEWTAVIPGAAFGADDFIRLSYAISSEQIEKGLKKIDGFIQSLE